MHIRDSASRFKGLEHDLEEIQVVNNDPRAERIRYLRVIFFSSRRIRTAAIVVMAAIFIAASVSIIPFVRSLEDRSRNEVEGALSWAELSIFASSTVLILGLVGEWFDDERWKKSVLYTVAKLFVIIGVAAELISNVVIFRATDVLQLIGEKEIAETKTEAEIAFGRANDRAAQANKAAAEANERTARVEAAAAWRVLQPDQIDRFVKSLSTSKHTIQIAFMKGDPESHFLELQFADAVQQAGWEFGSWEVHLKRVVFFGLAVLDDRSDGEAGRALLRALSEAGVGADRIVKLPGEGYEGDGGYQAAEVTLLIGSKFPPTSAVKGKPATP